jgi:hypothetical protein
MVLLVAPPASANVTLISFTATGYDEFVLVAWETATEFETLGFYVQRSDALNGEYIDISDLFFAEGDGATGASYSFDDFDVVIGTTYFYRLNVINSDQSEEFTDPVWATPGVTYTPTPTRTLGPSATSTQTATATATSPPGAGNTPTITHTPTSTTSPRTPTSTLRPSATRTGTNFPVVTFTSQPTITPTPQDTPTITNTPTLTPTATTTLQPLPSITLIFPAAATSTETPTATRPSFYTRTPTLTATAANPASGVPLRVSFLGVIVVLAWILLAAFLVVYLRRLGQAS